MSKFLKNQLELIRGTFFIVTVFLMTCSVAKTSAKKKNYV